MNTYLTFLLLALIMVLTPGPNMAYLVSRSIAQGRTAGLISLGGVGLGFLIYMLCAAFGLTALLLAVPFAYDALRLAGAAYLLYLAWQALRPGGHSPFQVRDLPRDSRRKLFSMGFLTSLLNPKIAVFYLSVIPQFIDPARGSVLWQSLLLGATQIAVSVSVNRADRVRSGLDCCVPREPTDVVATAALHDGCRARRLRHPHGTRSQEVAGTPLLAILGQRADQNQCQPPPAVA